jgi:hypothetical protein
MDMTVVMRRNEKEKTGFLMEKYGLYIRGEISRQEYIQTVCLPFAALSVSLAHNGEVEVGFRAG